MLNETYLSGIIMDDFVFADEQVSENEENTNPCWKLLIVDDEKEVHAVTKLALRDFEFLGRNIEFISAYSGIEAQKILDNDRDIAVILLDVVMETDDAGLKVARYVREVTKNHMVRIVLRTGQPGQTPERDVIVTYDINDYKSKTELTSQRLFTTIVASFRSYRDLVSIESNRLGLERVISASSDLFSTHSMGPFVHGLLMQLNAVFNHAQNAFELSSFVAEHHASPACEKSLTVVAAQGDFSGQEGELVAEVLPSSLKNVYLEAQKNNQLIFGEGYILYYSSDPEQISTLVFICGIPADISEHDHHLIELFSRNVQIAYDNILLSQEIEDTQREIVYRLGNALETRSKETGNHLKRVAHFAALLAKLAGIDEQDIATLRLAAPLHDVGKIGIPDSVLNHPGPLDSQQWEIMKTHAQIGHDLLQDSTRKVLKTGALISLTHHEKWDGSGYPYGLSGDDIHIFGRIVSLVDVFDALYNKRCYKPAFETKICTQYIVDNSGIAFDPTLVDIFMLHLDQFMVIMHRYPN
jgi:response regulator RpfG family c-di-GMP phosphodiesterase